MQGANHLPRGPRRTGQAGDLAIGGHFTFRYLFDQSDYSLMETVGQSIVAPFADFVLYNTISLIQMLLTRVYVGAYLWELILRSSLKQKVGWLLKDSN